MTPMIEALHIDWMPQSFTGNAKIGLSTLPGRNGCGRSATDDIACLQRAGVEAVLCLLSVDELAYFGVSKLLESYREAGMEVLNLPTRDQLPPSISELEASMKWIAQQLQAKRNVLIHCVGGLGRAGTVAGCWLRMQGLNGVEAIQLVRKFRSPRAIESPRQEAAVLGFDLVSVNEPLRSSEREERK